MTTHSPGSKQARGRQAISQVFRQAAATIVLAALAACAPVQSGEIDTTARPMPAENVEPLVRATDARSAREALARMSDRWRSQWYHTAVVRLEVTLFGLGAPAPGEWAQTIRVPGRARVDYLPLESKSGVLYTPGMVYGFQEGERAATEERTDLAMIAFADLPGLAPDSAMSALAAARVDTTLFRVSNESGAHVWIIGGGTNDSLRSEVAIDAERLLVRRATDVRPLAQRTLTTEARVASWRDQDGLLLPEVIDRWREGTRTLQERWAAVVIDVALPINLFDPAQWAKVQPPAPPTVRR